MISPNMLFQLECKDNVDKMILSQEVHDITFKWLTATATYKYSYNYTWLGRPIIQYPQDIAAMQELIWQVKPDLIIETGIAHGGSLCMSASMLALLDYCDAVEAGTTLDPLATHRLVLGIDIDIRSHNRAAIEAHPLAHKINMIQGSSIAPKVISQVHGRAKDFKRVMVCLDSSHTHEHVLAELEAYAPLTTKDSYCVVFDTVIEDMSDDMFQDRPWGKGNNPKTAVLEYLRLLKEEGRKAIDGEQLTFESDGMIENKLLITVAPKGYLRRVN
jgi:cephalosporin hydroxylase